MTLDAPLGVTVSQFIRWFWLNEWVTDESRIHVAFTMLAAAGVCTVNACPYGTSVGRSDDLRAWWQVFRRAGRGTAA